jgi:hypothetical protein
MPCPGSAGGRGDILFPRPSKVTEVEQKRKGNKRGCKRAVGEAFAGRSDTKPQNLEDRTTSFRMGYEFCDNYT